MCTFIVEVETLGTALVATPYVGPDCPAARAVALRALRQPGTLQVSLARWCGGVERHRATRVAPAFGGAPVAEGQR